MKTNRRRFLAALPIALIFVITSCSIDLTPPERLVAPPEAAGPALSTVATPSQDRLTHWNTLSDDSLWAVIARADSTVDVGLRLPGMQSGMDRGRVVLQVQDRASALTKLGAMTGSRVLNVDALLPIAHVRLLTATALGALRRSPYVSFVEPAYFVGGPSPAPWTSFSSGCSVGAYSGPANTTIAPGDVLPWNYSAMNIPLAWNRAGGGRGVTVGIVDTGVDYFQRELNADFIGGMSSGRTFIKEATSNSTGPAAWHDDCGHGTRMASVIGAPRNGQYMLGVAWEANLYMVRVDNDVLLTNVSATRLGIRSAAQNAKIIAMAFGTIAYYSSIAQEIDYWYNFDKLFFAAAGTSFCGDPLQSTITFPGNLSTVTTVTALDPNGTVACNSHYGLAVDFAAYANQPAVGLAALGSTLAGFAGTSDATGVLAGLAALTLSLRPSATRSEILSDLRVAASPTGYLSPTIGWGAPNALCVVRSMCVAWIAGTSLIQTLGTRNYTWTAGQLNSPGPFAYKWSTGETTQSITRSISVWSGMTEYTLNLSVTITDVSTGSITIPISKEVLVRDPQGCPTCT